MSDGNRTFLDFLMGLAPAIVGVIFLGAGIGWVWFVHQYGGVISPGGVGLLCGIGLACLGYWAFANKHDGYNF